MSRQTSPLTSTTPSPGSSPIDQRTGDISQPSSSSPRRMSKDSEGYPSWLPKRPPPPAPASTFHSSGGFHDPGPSEPPPFVGGRKATPRSVRIVSLRQSYADAEKAKKEQADQGRFPHNARAWSKATTAGIAPGLLERALQHRTPQPKFRSKGLRLELVRNDSVQSRLYFYLYPLFVFAHIPLQTFFDFNAVFILFQVSKFPNPEASGVPGSGRNWALGAAAYIACWAVWIFVVTVVYELIYSFVRRWRVKRPLVLPIYMSTPAFNFASMTSYSTFCFLQRLRYDAFFSDSGSIRDGLAETFWFYSQNLPTVGLLLPRAGLSLALLLAFTTPQPGVVALADAGLNHRDATFFRSQDGTLTNYARGVLIANAAWTAWRVLVLLFSWIGLWVVSGHGCAGFCGPRYRWEEEEAEKTRSVYSDDASELDAVLWSWRECARARIELVYNSCLTLRPSPRWSQAGKKGATDARELLGSGPISPDAAFDGMEQVLAAAGFPTVPTPARRGLLSDQLFESPQEETSPVIPELSSIIPKVVKRSSKEKQPTGPEAPLMTLPYPFTAPGAKASSNDRVPFPPSTAPSDEHLPTSGSGSSEETPSSEEVEEENDDEDEIDESEEPSSGRASGSMSSLGQPVTSRYPFQFRRPVRGTSVASSSPTHMTPYSHTQSIQSRFSGRTESTGNQESSDSHSPRSHTTSGSEMASPLSQSSYGIPMPPRHPQQAQGRGRARAGTVPAVFPVSPSPVVFPRGRPRARTRTESGATSSAGAFDPYGSDLDLSSSGGHGSDHPEADESHEAERDDVVGLLTPPSAAPSPKVSFIRSRASLISQHRGHGSRSGASSRTNSHSGSSSSRSRTNSISVSVRERAQSLIQSVGAASQSSLELVQTAIRSRAHSSMARLEEDSPYYSDNYTHSRSGSSSNNENYTFGHPLRTHLHMQDEPAVEEENTEDLQKWAQSSGEPTPRDSGSNLSVSAPSQRPSERTVSQAIPQHRPEAGSAPVAIPIPIPRSHLEPNTSAASSPPDISTAAQSFVTAPATVEGTTDSSGGTSWGTSSHMVDRSDGTWRPA